MRLGLWRNPQRKWFKAGRVVYSDIVRIDMFSESLSEKID
jgi:hypothetical protein